MRDVIMGAAKWIIEYLEIPNYLHVRLKGRFEGEKIYKAEEEYWRDILGPSFYQRKLRNPRTAIDDVVILENFQLSPWFPRVPGLYWTPEGYALGKDDPGILKHSKALGFHYPPDEKERRVLRGGYGTLRVQKREELQLFGATTSGNLNAAVPVLISNKVSQNLLRFSKKNPLMEVDLKGVIKPIPYTYQYQYRFSHIPKLCLYVNSILNVRKYVSDFKLRASAWTIYHNPRAPRQERYGYSYSYFNPIDESSIIEATNWIQDYIYEYTKGKGFPITDYDEVIPRFNTAVLPLQAIMEGNVDYETVNSLFGGIDFRRQAAVQARY